MPFFDSTADILELIGIAILLFIPALGGVWRRP